MQKSYVKFLSLVVLLLASFSVNGLTVHIVNGALSGCAPFQTSFHSTTTGGVTYTWNVDGGISHADSASHIFSTVGPHTVYLTVDSAGYSASDSVVVTVNPLPTVHFTVNDTTVCPGIPITYIDLSTAGAPGTLRRRWDFGDGNFSASDTAHHAYTLPGYYSITLFDTNSNGCIGSGTVNHYIHVFSRPNVYADVDQYSFCNAPATITPYNTSSGAAPLTYFWRFGDGLTGIGIAPPHTYTQAGTYTISLRVTDGNGCIDSNTVPYTIMVNSTGFRYDTNVCLHSAETFIDTSHGARNSVTWTFGDGSPVSHADTVATHTYNTPGVYTVNLSINYIYNWATSFTCNVSHNISITPFTDSFTITPVHPCPEQDTLHYNGMTHYGDTVRWSFGDHGTASGDTVSHIFYPGALDSVFHFEGCTPVSTYVLNRTAMYITDRHGCRDTVRRIDTVYNMLFDIKPSSYGGCAALTDTFRVSAKTTVPYLYPPGTYPYSITSYLWNFGDGSPTSTAAVPIHTFISTGVYSVICTITTSNGCTFKDTVLISVGSHPSVTYTAVPSTLCYGSGAVAFTADTSTSTVHIDHLVWNYGDGTKDSTGLVLHASHIFQSAGNLPVKLTAYNQGCP